MRGLITGADGQLGTALRRRGAERGHDLVGIDIDAVGHAPVRRSGVKADVVVAGIFHHV